MSHNDQQKTSRFFAVIHNFRKGVVSSSTSSGTIIHNARISHSHLVCIQPVLDWWGAFIDTNHNIMANRQHSNGLFRHCFLPSAQGPIFALYESKQALTSSEIEAQIDAPDGPNGDWGALETCAHPVSDQVLTSPSVLPPSAWPTIPGQAAPSSGSIFWVLFTRRTGHSDDETTIWRKHNGEPGRLASPYPDKLHNHLLLTTTHQGEEDNKDSTADQILCVWETREPMGAEEFSGFLSGPASPIDASAYSHVVHGCDPSIGSYAVELPSSKPPRSAPAFPRRAQTGFMGKMGFMGSLWMPMMDDSMNSVSDVPHTILSYRKDDDISYKSQYASWEQPHAADHEPADLELVTGDTRDEMLTVEDGPTTEDDLDDEAFEKIVEALPMSVKGMYSKLQRDRAMRKAGAKVNGGGGEYDEPSDGPTWDV